MQTGYLFTFYTLAIWWSEAIFHSIVFYWGASLLIESNGTLQSNGQTADMVLFGNFIMSAAVLTVLVKIAIEIKYEQGIFREATDRDCARVCGSGWERESEADGEREERTLRRHRKTQKDTVLTRSRSATGPSSTSSVC